VTSSNVVDPVVVAVFVLVYAGMMLGGLPGLAIDRTGVALLGAITLVATDRLGVEAAWLAVDVRTIALLTGLMVVSAQLRLGGFYTALTRRIGEGEHTPGGLLALVVLASGVLSAVLANDVVCLAMAPVLVEIAARRGLAPVPFLLALACASNVGSAATLIGNPQNMLIGQALQLSFARYLVDGGVPALAGLAVVWTGVWWSYRRRWRTQTPVPDVQAPPFDRWQTIKGLTVVVVLMGAFLAAPWPRELVALVAAGVILVSRRMASREMLGLVDWHLLVLFVSLFVVNAAVAESGLFERLMASVQSAGLSLSEPAVLFGATAVLSNLLSNVPAVMLLLPTATHESAGAVLALSSTLAGNLLIVGSIANIIVVDQAARLGITIDWKTHARVGVPVTAGTLGVAAIWLALLG
jgi:Na+/H+ antiporter NhaD/arsenite permease-like protein